MSGCVTVTGPPRAICSRKRGTTLPVEPSTLPKRTMTNCVRLALQRLADHLGEALGRAHHVRRVDRLVGRYEHELSTLPCCARARATSACRKHVVRHRLERVLLLHQRHVLVRGGVEDDLRPRRANTSLDAPRVLGVADDRGDGTPRQAVAELLLDRVQGELRASNSTRRAGAKRAIWRQSSEPIEPPAPVTSTVLPVEERVQPGVVELDRVAPEQVVELDRAQRRHAHLARDDVRIAGTVITAIACARTGRARACAAGGSRSAWR